nr:PREDICTED: proteoglycan 4 isoform X3 [Equus przewalskii]
MEWKILPIYLLLLLSIFSIQEVSSQELSCKGRCFESFARGRECDCDADCKKYGKCCSDYESFCEEVHNPTSPPSSKTAPPPPGASQTIKSTAKRSPKSNKKKTKKVIESEEIIEEHSVSENQESSSSSSSSSSTIRKVKSSKNSAANRELKKKPKVKDSKKKRTPKKKPTPEPPVIDEAGSGLDNGDFMLIPTPKIPTTQRNKVTTSPKITTVKPINPKPSLPPNSDTSKETTSTPNKETTVETKETEITNKETSTSANEKTTSARKSTEKTSDKDFAPASEVPAKSTPKAETTTKSPSLTTTKGPAPTTAKGPAPTTTKKPTSTTTEGPAPTTPEEPAPTPPEEPALTTPKKQAPTTTTEPILTTPKEPAPITTKEPALATSKKPPPSPTPKEPAPTSPETPAPTTSEASTTTTTMKPPTTPKNLAESTPEFPAEPTPKALENSPKEPAVPTTKAPEVTKPEVTTTAKDKVTGKDIHTIPEITTAAPKITTETATTTEEKTTESKVTSTVMQVTSTTEDTTTSSKITPKATTLAPKVMTATKTTTTQETINKLEETTAIPKDTATHSKVTTPKPKKPTKAPRKPTSTKKPKTPRKRKPKTTPIPPKITTPTTPKSNPTTLAEAMLQTTTSPNQTPNSAMIEVNPKNEDADAAEGEKPLVILRPHVLTPIVIPGPDFLVRGPNLGIGINPMLSDETNLCNGKPVDGLTTLRNGTLVAFRGHYFWMLRPFSPPSPPRRITEVWGIPSPIDTVFTRCNCEGKTFFFKDSQYWRFTNDIKDAGYPKLISKGFGGLSGKIVAALSIATYKNRPESVYFFKRGGRIQQYIYKQEPIRKCPGRRPAIHYSVYGEAPQIRRRRFERAIGPSQTHTIRIHYSPVRVSYQDKVPSTDFLHNEVKVSTLWRGLPDTVTSAISLPNLRKPDGYDYYAFSKDQYYNIDVPSRTARAITTRSGQTLSKVWYNCP